MWVAGMSRMLAAAATQREHAPECKLCMPHSSATSADEQAVSMVETGPWMPSTNDSRPEAIETWLPVAAYTLSAPAEYTP
eukprot:4275748-Prymnesium_polylepis.3